MRVVLILGAMAVIVGMTGLVIYTILSILYIFVGALT